MRRDQAIRLLLILGLIFALLGLVYRNPWLALAGIALATFAEALGPY
jgi:predicted RND superfamily exporter protein